jgi:hypothetical protein
MCGPKYDGKRVSDYNYEDLPRFARSIMMHTAEGNYDLQDHEEGKFCLLSELFDITDGIYISIDLKDSSHEMVSKVENLIKQYKRE